MQRQQQNNGIGFPGALTIAFIVLKLTHVISWSWLWVLSPLWIGAAFILCIFGMVFIAMLVGQRLRERRTRQRRGRLHKGWGIR